MTLENLPNRVWMYWEDLPDRRRASYLDLCYETIRHQATGLEVIVTDRESIFDFLPDLDAAVWERLPGPNYRSDYARTRLLYHYGGLWADYDLIAIRPLSELLAFLRDSELFGWGRENRGRFYAGLFVARPGSAFVQAWLEAQDRAVQGLLRGEPVPWALLADHITRPLAAAMGYPAWPMEQIAPVMWWEWRRFTSRLDSAVRVLAPSPYTVMLFHKVMGPWFGDWTPDQLLRSPTLLSRLFRIALGLTTPEQEDARRGLLAPLAQARFSPYGMELEKQYRWRLLKLPRDEV